MKSSSNWIYPSDIELYYAPDATEKSVEVVLGKEESHHAFRVMRHAPGDMVFVTNGTGHLFQCELLKYYNNICYLSMSQSYYRDNIFGKIHFFLPVLRSTERTEFGLEKLVEMGFSNFTFYASNHSVKKSINLERLRKIALQAMKQSLNLYTPNLSWSNKLTRSDGSLNLYFDQKGETSVSELDFNTMDEISVYIGPEGGFSAEERDLLSNAKKLSLAPNRLRSETAGIYAGAQLHSLLLKEVK